jgi:hypothetical protein
MNKYNNISDKQLQELFKKITLDTPSIGFTENLMLRIEKEAAKEQKKRILITFGQIAAGIAAMILLPALAIYLCGLFIPEFTFAFSFSFPKIDLDFDANLIAIGLSVLFLLMVDTLCRKYISERK